MQTVKEIQLTQAGNKILSDLKESRSHSTKQLNYGEGISYNSGFHTGFSKGAQWQAQQDEQELGLLKIDHEHTKVLLKSCEAALEKYHYPPPLLPLGELCKDEIMCRQIAEMLVRQFVSVELSDEDIIIYSAGKHRLYISVSTGTTYALIGNRPVGIYAALSICALISSRYKIGKG